MVKFKPYRESSLAHSSLFEREPHAEPESAGKTDTRFRHGVFPHPAVTLFPFKTGSHFLGDTFPVVC